jgi:hypothetical protein
MNFTEMQTKSSDIIVWILLKGPGIDYPLTQSNDNSYYLAHTAKKPNRLGSLFLDYRGNRDFFLTSMAWCSDTTCSAENVRTAIQNESEGGF